jgi:hypothetical protein
MTDIERRLTLALSMAEAAVQDMAEAGLSHQDIAIGLAWHVRKQVKMAMPTEETRELFTASLLA